MKRHRASLREFSLAGDENTEVRCDRAPIFSRSCSPAGGKRERPRFVRYAAARFRQGWRLNIRLSSRDLEAIQKRALAEGLPSPD